MSTAKWTADVEVHKSGSLLLFEPMTDPASDWLEKNTEGTWISGCLVVEQRYAQDLAQGLQDNGFTVE